MTIKVSKPAINIREELADLKQDTGLKGQELMRADTLAEARTAIGAGRKNIIYNGAMKVSQRGTSFAAVANGAYTLDRWRFWGNAGAFTVTQDSDAPAGFGSSCKVDCTTADTSLSASDYLEIVQNLEGQDLQSWKKGTADALPITMSFWVKTNKTGTYQVNFVDEDNSRRFISRAYSVSSADTWEKIEFTCSGDTTGAFNNDNGDSLMIEWWFGAGTNFTSGTIPTSWTAHSNGNRAASLNVNLADSTSNYWQITGVQLELGSVATEFEHRSYGEELLLCQRYYYKIDGGGYNWITEVQRHNNTGFRSVISLPVPLRDAPEIYHSGLAYWYNNGAMHTGTTSVGLGYTDTTNTVNITQLNIEYIPTYMALTSNGNLSAMLSFTSAGGYLAFDSEL